MTKAKKQTEEIFEKKIKGGNRNFSVDDFRKISLSIFEQEKILKIYPNSFDQKSQKCHMIFRMAFKNYLVTNAKSDLNKK
jgi:ABC-type branched-subunit amino acid transport system substrate-binding protein